MAAKEKKFHVFGQTLAALSWDGQGEPVLALHGWLDNAASFMPLATQWQRPMVALISPAMVILTIVRMA